MCVCVCERERECVSMYCTYVCVKDCVHMRMCVCVSVYDRFDTTFIQHAYIHTRLTLHRTVM